MLDDLQKLRSLSERYKEFQQIHPKMRIRDAARQMGVTEAELVQSKITDGRVRRLRRTDTGFSKLLEGLCGVGEVMCLTRNESAVHERHGCFGQCSLGKTMGTVLNRDIDLRIFMHRWAFGFIEEQPTKVGSRLSLQFFDTHGVAVHKIYSTAATNRRALEDLVGKWAKPTPDPIAIQPAVPAAPDRPDTDVDAGSLRTGWAGMADPHDYVFLLKDIGVGRLQSLRLIGRDWAYPVGTDAVTRLLESASETEVPIMVFVGNPGCIQIHTDPVQTVKSMGPWINVLDARFNLHLRTDHVVQAWVVKKPTDTGFVHSLEAYDAKGQMICQIFGERKPGVPELSAWRGLLDRLEQREQA